MESENNDPVNKLQESCEAWSKFIKLDAEQGLAQAIFTAALGSVEESNQFLGWLLGLTGVTIGLIVGNIAEVSKIIEFQAVKCALILLFISGFLGLISKVFSFYVGVNRLAIRELTLLAKPIFDNFYNEHNQIELLARPYIEPPTGELDLERVKDLISEPYNCLERRAIKNSFKKGTDDLLYAYKKAVWLFRWHGYFLIAQVLFLVSGFFTLIKNL